MVSSSLQQFDFECIGTTQTDDELVITRSLAEFGRLISSIEDERDRMVSIYYVCSRYIIPIDRRIDVYYCMYVKHRIQEDVLYYRYTYYSAGCIRRVCPVGPVTNLVCQ